MDLGFLLPKDLGFLSTIAILVFGWLGFRWLRDQQREGYEHESFRTAVSKIFSDAVQTDAYRERMDRVVGDAVASSFDPITQAIQTHDLELKILNGKVTTVEAKIEGVLGRLQTQRAGDHP